jgi:hypothetical protein
VYAIFDGQFVKVAIVSPLTYLDGHLPDNTNSRVAIDGLVYDPEIEIGRKQRE